MRIFRFESLKNWPRKCLERNGADRDNLIKILRAEMDGSNNGLEIAISDAIFDYDSLD